VRQIVSEAVPAYSTLLTTSKLNVIQSVISAVLIDKVFGVYFFGLLDERISQIQAMEEYLRTIGEISGCTPSPLGPVRGFHQRPEFCRELSRI
jgi:hypothetical protein